LSQGLSIEEDTSPPSADGTFRSSSKEVDLRGDTGSATSGVGESDGGDRDWGLGTLVLDRSGRARFVGSTAASEWLNEVSVEHGALLNHRTWNPAMLPSLPSIPRGRPSCRLYPTFPCEPYPSRRGLSFRPCCRRLPELESYRSFTGICTPSSESDRSAPFFLY
jgi:hypothetical protein